MDTTRLMTASGLPWRARREDTRSTLAMAQQHGISELLASVLAAREVSIDDAPHFLNPTLRDHLPDPFHLLDMDKAVARTMLALERGERIAIFGDYDVDGATSTTLLMDYLGALGAPITPYIPDRAAEGYGPTVAAFEKLIEGHDGKSLNSPLEGESNRFFNDSVGGNASPTSPHGFAVEANPAPPQGGSDKGFGATLIFTVDCGTLAHEPVAYAQRRGVDVIVLDHHLSSGALPNAHAIVNPNRVDETSPHRNLAAVGVTFLFLVALNAKLKEVANEDEAGSVVPPSGGSLPNLLSCLDLVALGTVCDVMPLTGLNRAFVAQGLKVMAQRKRLGMALLADVARMDEAPNTYHLGFLLGPRINAGGRVGRASLGVELLTCLERDHAHRLAAELDQLNAERQAIEASVLEQAMQAAEQQANLPVILVANAGWHQGVIGIVAGRLKEKFQRPAIVVALEEGVGKASGRSVPGVDMGAAIHAAVAESILEKGGGHAMAAGFSIAQENLARLHDFLIARMEAGVSAYAEARVMKFDGLLSVSGANLDTLEDIARAGPFGLGNPAPRFLIPNARILHSAVMKDKHLRLTLGDDSGRTRLNAVSFGTIGTTLGEWLAREKTLHLLGELKINRWQGQENVQFIIADAAKGEFHAA